MSKEILGPDVGFTDILDYEITNKLKAEAENRKAGKIKYHPLRPSSAGHCERKLALELMEYRGKAYYNKPLIEPNIDRLFSLGHSVEYSALRFFELIKIVEQRYKQQSLTLFTLDRGENFEQEIIEGSCDFVLWSKQWKAIGDVKSKKDGWSSFYKSKWDEEFEKLKALPSVTQISDTAVYADDLDAFIEDLNGDWLVDNLLQLNLYANSTFMKERGVTFAFLYRYNKNDSRHMEVRFKPSERVAKYVEEKFNKIARIVDKGDVSNLVCQFNIGSMRHAFCDCHKMLPYSETDPLKSFFATLPKKVWAKDSSSLKYAGELNKAYLQYSKGKEGEKNAQKAEEKIIKILTEQKVSKVQFDDGLIYEVKLLKTPKEHFELRRSK